MSYIQPEKVSLHESERLSQILDGLKLAKKNEQQIDPVPTVVKCEELETTLEAQCLTCKCGLPERDDQINHYKSDWHRYNIKLHLIGQPSITEEKFADAEDVISISGSESEEDADHLFMDENKRPSVSILKSDSSDENSQHDKQFNNRMPKIYFKNSSDNTISMYKKILYSRQNSDVDASITDLALHSLKAAHQQLWLILLFSAGHFAAAVFEGSKVVVHKTFHRYIVRAKRGTVQSINDGNKGSSAKSAGASLRRHNEAALEENIKTLLKSWKEEYVDNCSHIFLRIPQYRKSFFYGGKDPLLEQKDTRIRSVPFITRRPTFNEVKRIHQELYSVTIHGNVSLTDLLSSKRDGSPKVQKKKEAKAEKQSSPKPCESAGLSSADEFDLTTTEETISTMELETFQCSSNVKRKKQRKKHKATETVGQMKPEDVTETSGEQQASDDSADPLSQLSLQEKERVRRLYTACKTSNVNALNELLHEIMAQQNGLSTEDSKVAIETSTKSPDAATAQFLSRHIDNCGNTLLHIASKSGNKDVIFMLLECGSDPCVANFASLMPYCFCSNKEARNQYRRFRAKYPTMYDYKKAQVPSALTEEKEEMMKKKQAEKKKAQKLAKKEKEKKAKEEEEKKMEEQSEKDRFLALSDREKRLVAVERRMLNQPNAIASNARRCYSCAESLFAKVPFEYLQYQFCSIKCLKEHKSRNQKN